MVRTYTAFALFLLVLAGIQPDARSDSSWRDNTVSRDNTVRLGLLLCLTGDCAEWGNESLRGATIALDEINASGGVLGRRLELVTQDSKETNASEALAGYRALRSQEGVQFIVGPTWTPAGLAIAPVAKRDNGVIVVSPSLGVADFDRAGENLFNVWPHDELSSRLLARHVIERGWKRIALFSTEQPWTQAQVASFRDELEKRGGSVAAFAEPSPSARDLKAEALRLAASKPDAIFVGSTAEQAGISITELRRAQYRGPILSVLLERTTLELAGGASEGVISARPLPAGQSFQEMYRERYRAEPGITADTAYDTVRVLAEAIRRAGSTVPQDVQKTLAGIASFPGASGEITFDEFGGVTREPKLVAVRSGQIEYLE